MATPSIKTKIPSSARKGEVVEIKTAITHDMESGQRKDKDGKILPRKIINKVICKYNGKEVFSADWHPAISANPYLSFFVRAKETGTIELAWHDDDGSVYTATGDIKVS